ncbi:MAG: hypothetical protein AAFV95_19565 [Bacteroidota bacterium]
MDSSLLQFIVDENLLADVKRKEIIPSESWNSLFDPNQKKKPFQLIPPQVAMGAFYGNIPQIDSTTSNDLVFFQHLMMDAGVQVKGMPIHLNGRLVFNHSQWQKKMSSFSIAFDHQAFLHRFGQDLYPEWSVGADLPSLDALQMTERESARQATQKADRQIIQQEIRFLVYQKIITHHKFIKMLESKDSLQSTSMNQQVDVPKNQNQQAQKLLNKYRDSWENRKTYYGDSLRQVKHRIDQHHNRLNAIQNQNVLRKKILQTQQLKLIEKLLLVSKKIKLGRSVIQDSWYTAENLPINGFQYGFDTGKWEGEFAIGRQVFNNHFSPAWGSNLFNQINGGQVLFAKATYKLTEQTELSYSVLRLKETGRFSTPYVIAPQNNLVFSIGARSKLSDILGIRSEWSFSRSVWGQPDVSIDNQIGRRNIAGEATVTGQWSKNKLETELGYFYVGPDFISAGNPFMQNNQQGMIAKARGQLGRRIKMEGEVRLGQSIDQRSIAGGKQNDWQIIGSIHWQLLQNLIVSAQASPNYFRQFGTSEVTISHQNMLYHLFAQSQHKIRNRLLTQTMGMSNFHSNLHLTDSSWNNATRQVYWQSSLLLSARRSLSVLSLWGINQGQTSSSNKQHTFFTELGYGWEGDRLNIKAASQLVKDATLNTWFVGMTQSIQFQVFKNTQFTADVSYQLPTQTDERQGKHRYWGRLEIIQTF